MTSPRYAPAVPNGPLIRQRTGGSIASPNAAVVHPTLHPRTPTSPACPPLRRIWEGSSFWGAQALHSSSSPPQHVHCIRMVVCCTLHLAWLCCLVVAATAALQVWGLHSPQRDHSVTLHIHPAVHMAEPGPNQHFAASWRAPSLTSVHSGPAAPPRSTYLPSAVCLQPLAWDVPLLLPQAQSAAATTAAQLWLREWGALAAGQGWQLLPPLHDPRDTSPAAPPEGAPPDKLHMSRESGHIQGGQHPVRPLEAESGDVLRHGPLGARRHAALTPDTLDLLSALALGTGAAPFEGSRVPHNCSALVLVPPSALPAASGGGGALPLPRLARLKSLIAQVQTCATSSSGCVPLVIPRPPDLTSTNAPGVLLASPHSPALRSCVQWAHAALLSQQSRFDVVRKPLRFESRWDGMISWLGLQLADRVHTAAPVPTVPSLLFLLAGLVSTQANGVIEVANGIHSCEDGSCPAPFDRPSSLALRVAVVGPSVLGGGLRGAWWGPWASGSGHGESFAWAAARRTRRVLLGGTRCDGVQGGFPRVVLVQGGDALLPAAAGLTAISHWSHDSGEEASLEVPHGSTGEGALHAFRCHASLPGEPSRPGRGGLSTCTTRCLADATWGLQGLLAWDVPEAGGGSMDAQLAAARSHVAVWWADAAASLAELHGVSLVTPPPTDGV